MQSTNADMAMARETHCAAKVYSAAGKTLHTTRTRRSRMELLSEYES